MYQNLALTALYSLDSGRGAHPLGALFASGGPVVERGAVAVAERDFRLGGVVLQVPRNLHI